MKSSKANQGRARVSTSVVLLLLTQVAQNVYSLLGNTYFTYHLIYDGIVSSRIVSRYSSTESSLNVPPLLAEDLAAKITSEILNIYLRLPFRFGTPAVSKDQLAVQRRCYETENYDEAVSGRTCIVNHDHDLVKFQFVLTLEYVKNEIVTRLDATMSTSSYRSHIRTGDNSFNEQDIHMTPPISKEVLIMSIPKINALVEYYHPLWTVQARPSVLDKIQHGSDGPYNHPASLENVMLSKPDLYSRMRIDSINMFPSSSTENKVAQYAQVWQYFSDNVENVQQQQVELSRAFFLDNTLRAISTFSGSVHAEAMVTPAFLSNMVKKRIAILSAMPLASLQHLLKLSNAHKAYNNNTDNMIIELVGVDMDAYEIAVKYNVTNLAGEASLLCDNTHKNITSVNNKCVSGGSEVVFVQDELNDWIEKKELKQQEEEIGFSFDIIYVDDDYYEKEPTAFFHQTLRPLLGPESILVVNTRQKHQYSLLHDSSSERMKESYAGYDSTHVYNEPTAVPLNSRFVISFCQIGQSFSRFQRTNPAEINRDIAILLSSSQSDFSFSVYNGVTQLIYNNFGIV